MSTANTYKGIVEMRVLADRSEIEKAQRALEKVVTSNATLRVGQISDPGGYREGRIHWIDRVELWANFEKRPDVPRYWNLFGLGQPDPLVHIVCEINPPVSGIDRRSAGAFGRSGKDLYLLHRGHFNAYRGRIPKRFVRVNFEGRWCSVDDGGRESKLLMVGKLSDSQFVTDLRDFVSAAVKLKQNYKGR